MMFYGGLFLHFFIGLAASQGLCFTKFHTEMACVIPYGVSMNDVWSVSLIDCARACNSNASCASLIFFQGINMCRLNEQILTNITTTCWNPEKYAEKIENSQCGAPGMPVPTTTSTTTTGISFSTTTSTTTTTTTTVSPVNGPPSQFDYMMYPYFFMSDPCVGAIECTHILNSECRDGICQCISGYSFDWTTRGCVAGCHSYGHSYQVEHDTTSGYDIRIDNLSEEQCLNECTNYPPNFKCKSLVYGVSTMACYLSNETSLTYPPSSLNGYNLYHRDCLFV